MTKDGQTVIVFENPEVPDRILERTHVFRGKVVDVRPSHARKQFKEDYKERVEACILEVEPNFMRLLRRVHKEKLEQIERDYHLRIVWPENEARVEIKPTPLTEETHYQEGCDAFIDLYQTINHTMKRQVIDVKDIHDDGKIKKTAFLGSSHPVVIEKVEALRAIISGNYGMPKEACAGAIFRAIDEFSPSIDVQCSTLRDIRVVIIDAETTEVFSSEFINRYYSKQDSQNQMGLQRRPSNEEAESPFCTNLSKKREILATNFFRKEGNTKAAAVGRVMKYKATWEIKHPPSPLATKDNLNLAKQPMEIEKHQQFTDFSDVNSVNQPDANKANTKEDEKKPPDKSNKSSKRDCHYSDPNRSQGSQTTLRCSICRNSYQELVEPRNCGHTFCQSCIDNTTDGSICSNQWCICERSQPIGSMAWRTEKQPLPGYPDYYSIAVTYNFPSGTQGWEHPTPGHPYHERFFTAYLPSNPEGQKICELLKRAFDARLLFRI
ncbi:E3 ubiquitin-protein ligase DTX3L, partial [Stylophora pistillata]